MKPSGRIPRKTRLARGAFKRKKRSASEYARIYGSSARVRWVKSLPCVGCGRVPTYDAPNDNAHTENEGKSRKGHHSTIAPLCHDAFGRVGCHTKYDRRLPPFDTELARDAVKLHAAVTDARWQRMGELTPLSAIVPGVVAGMLERSEGDD